MNNINIHFFLRFIIIPSLLITSNCSHFNKVNEIYSNVQILNNQFDQLSNEIQTLNDDLQLAKDEVYRANQRIDNFINKIKYNQFI